jgi:hypothetical protein
LPSLFREEQKVDIGNKSGNAERQTMFFMAVFQNSKQQAKHAEIERKYNNKEE